MSETLFQRALKREALVTPPIWMMRQAGRYHSHYQNMKKTYSFMDLCKNPELAAEVAMGPIRDFDFDVSILFSDLLFPLEMLGMPLTYNPGPQLGWHLENDQQLLGFKKVEEALKGMEFQAEAVRKTRELLPTSKSLIGFVGGPWTLFVYAVEGSHKGELKKSLSLMGLYKKFAELMVPFLQKNIELQLAAGAEVVLVMDTAAGEIDAAIYAEHLVGDVKKLMTSKTGYYMKHGTSAHYNSLAGHGAGFGYDHHFDMATVLKETKQGFVQGNFNQDFMTLESADFEKEFENFLAPLKKLTPAERAGWVANLGHGITPQAKEANVKRFVEGIRNAFK
ncbi:MAG: uroporphyrinogen decarboxylase family protein [Bdellovibrionota bacterium]